MWPNEDKIIKGFGYDDAMDIVAKDPDWIIEGILPTGFGFVAGAPKANNSPHGGKSILVLEIVKSLISNKSFLQKTTQAQQPILLVNLDQAPHEVSGKFKQMLAGATQRGLMISQAYALQFPADIKRLELDIQKLKPKILIVDPLLRCAGGKDIKDATNTGPIIDGLKKLSREYAITILVVHHSVKNPERDKESTGSWLSGSTDLDSAWDFCLCLEWNRDEDRMHLRCFFRSFGKTNVYYIARKNSSDQIIGLECTNHTLALDAVLQAISAGNQTASEISKVSGVPISSVNKHLKKYAGIKVKIVGKCKQATRWELI